MTCAHKKHWKTGQPICESAKLDGETWARTWAETTCEGCLAKRESEPAETTAVEAHPVKPATPEDLEQVTGLVTVGIAVALSEVTKRQRKARVPDGQVHALSEATVALLVHLNLADFLNHPVVLLGAAVVSVGISIAKSPTLTPDEFAAVYGGDEEPETRDAPEDDDA